MSISDADKVSSCVPTGMFSAILNDPNQTPSCKVTQSGHLDTINNQSINLLVSTFSDYLEVYNPEQGIDKTELRPQIKLGATLCFGKGGNYYKATGDLSKLSNRNITLEGAATSNYIIICSYDKKKTITYVEQMLEEALKNRHIW